MDKFEILERYILNELSPEERTEIEERLESDPDFQAQYEQMKDLIIAIESHSLRESLKDRMIQPNSGEQVKNTPINTQRSKIYWILAAAASILIIVYCGWWIYNSQSPSFKEIMADAFYVDPGLPTKMSATDLYQFYDAMLDYKTGDYSLALDKWSSINTGIGADTLNYYRAMAYLNMEKFHEAEDLLNKISQDSPLFQKAEWRKLEIYIRTQKYEKALAYLKQLPTDIHPSYKKVKAFLKNQ